MTFNGVFERFPKLRVVSADRGCRTTSRGVFDTIQRSLAHMTFNGVFERFPKLRVVSAENDIGWMPYYLERMDYVFDRRRNLYQMNLSRETPPSEMVRSMEKRNVFLTFMRDKAGVMNRGLIGVNRIMWSSDYPHGDSTWPRSQEM